MQQISILMVGYRGKQSHIVSLQREGMRVSLLIQEEEHKPAYEQDFDEVIVVSNIYEWNQVQDSLKGYEFDGVFTRFEDFTIIVSAIADDRGLPSVAYENASNFRNKYLMRQAFRKVDAPSADFALIAKMNDAEELIATHGFPLILKQISGIHSKYVIKVHSLSDLEKKLQFFQQDIRKNSGNLQQVFRGYPKHIEQPDPCTYFLLEELMSGIEITVDTFVVDGEPFFTPICKYTMSEDLGFEDHHLPIRTLPFDVTSEQEKHIYNVTKQGLDALGANYCVTHAEHFFDPETGECRIIEIAARGGGFRAEMVRHSYGADYDLGIARAALGLDPNIKNTPHKAVAVAEVFSEKNGILRSIDFSCLEGESDISHVTQNCYPGQKVGRAADGKSFIVKFLVETQTYDLAEKRAQDLLLEVRESIVVE